MPQNRKNWHFWYKFAKKGIPLNGIFYTKFRLEKGVQDPHPHAKFHCCGFKNVGLQPQNRENW